MQDTQTGSDRAEQRADAVHGEAEPEQPRSAVAIGQLAAGDHERGHHQQEDRYRHLDPLDGGVQILAHVVDHHVHIRTGEAADELRQRERNEHPPQRRRRPTGRSSSTHFAPAPIRNREPR